MAGHTWKGPGALSLDFCSWSCFYKSGIRGFSQMPQILLAVWTILLPWLTRRGELIGPDLIRFSPDTNITKSAALPKSLIIAWLRTKFAKHYWCFDILQNSVWFCKSKCKIAFGLGIIIIIQIFISTWYGWLGYRRRET